MIAMTQPTLKEVLEKSKLTRSEISKRLWQNPQFRAKTSAATRKGCQTPESRAKLSEAMKEVARRPEVRAKRRGPEKRSRFELNRLVAEYCNGRETVSAREIWRALGISSTIVGRVLLNVGYVRETEKDVWTRVWPAEKKFRGMWVAPAVKALQETTPEAIYDIDTPDSTKFREVPRSGLSQE